MMPWMGSITPATLGALTMLVSAAPTAARYGVTCSHSAYWKPKSASGGEFGSTRRQCCNVIV